MRSTASAALQPALAAWTILTTDAPLLGASERAPDGVENVAVFARGGGAGHVMIYSEGLEQQHLAHMTSDDEMYTWTDRGPLRLAGLGGTESHAWLAGRYGAPFVWWEPSTRCHLMALMGEYDLKTHRSAFGLLFSPDGERWVLLADADDAQQADRPLQPQAVR